MGAATGRRRRALLAVTAVALVAAVAGCHGDGADRLSFGPPGYARGAVVGYVRDHDGRPIADASWGALDGPPNIIVQQRSTRSDYDGFYVSVPLPPGRYLTAVSHPMYEMQTSWVTVRAGEASRVDFRLRRK
jgi:hypothetical protein